MSLRLSNFLIFVFLIFFVVRGENYQVKGDTVRIEVEGYRDGEIQWQISQDSVLWSDIDHASDHYIEYVIKDDCFFRVKQLIRGCFYYSQPVFVMFDPTKKIYGVRIDRTKGSENAIERIYYSEKKVSKIEIEGELSYIDDDFKKIYPYNSMQICNIKSDLDGNVNIVYQTQEGFSRDEDTFVEIPIFYMNRFFEEKYDYRLISQTKYEGFYPAPMFVEGDKILDKVYVAVYETSMGEDRVVRSVTGKLPLTEKNINNYRELYKNKGNGYSSIDLRTIMSLQHLYLIRFANKNTQELVGGGWVNLRQPSFKILNNGPSNNIVIAELENSVDVFWFKNQNVCIVKKNDHDVEEYATLLDYKKNYPSKGFTTFIIDKTLKFDTTMFFGSSAQLTGWSDVIKHDTGRTKPNTTNKDNETCSVKLFEIENLWGNVWEFVDGLYFKGLTPYIGFDMQKYDQEESYELTNFLCIEQDSNNAGNKGFITNLGIDEKYTWVSFPDLLWSEGVDAKNGYGDYFYQSNDLNRKRYSVFGGGFDHFFRAGLFNFRNWNSSTTFWYLYGSRMQFKFR